MYWQFGGNVEPVTTTCKYDWAECPLAIVDYIWSEVVTDVADSLANESILWRILAVLLICTTVVHLIYWKIRWMTELKKNKANLEQFNSKLQDLELKVNILTYKAQYGTWPLPHIEQRHHKNSLHSIQSTLSKLNEDNSWFKHLLTNARRKRCKEESITYNLESKLSITDSNAFNVETKYASSTSEDRSLQPTISVDENLSRTSLEKKKNIEVVNDDMRVNQIRKVYANDSSITNVSEELSTDNKKKSYRSFSENRLSDHLKSIILGSKQNLGEISSSEYEFLDNYLSERKAFISNKCTDVKSKTPLNFNLLSKSAPKLEEQIFSTSTTDTEIRTDTQETLYQVRRKLENLHLALQSYSLKDSSIALLQDNRNSKRIKTNFEENNIYDFTENTCHFNKHKYVYNNETSTDSQTAPINISDSSEILTTHITSNNMCMNGQLLATYTGHAANENYTTLKNIEVRPDEEVKSRGTPDKLNIFTLKKELSTYKEEFDKSLSETNSTNNNSYYTDLDIRNKNNDLIAPNSMELTNDETSVISRKSSSVAISKGSDSDDKSTTTLLQEALMIKQELVCKIESKDDNDDNYDYVEWSNDQNHFQSKILDMITEESSGSSSTDKKSKSKSKAFIPQIIEEPKYSGDDIYNKAGNEQENNNDIALIDNYSIEVPENIINDEEKLISSESIEVVENSRTLDIKSSNDTVEMNKNTTCEIEISNTTENKESDLEGDCEISTGILEVSPCQNIDSLDSKADVTSSHLTESSSDTSVNRLLDRLIETERNCKSAKKLSKTILEKEFIQDSLNNLINSNNSNESAHSENEECDNSSLELETDKFSPFEDVKILVDNFETNNKEDNIQNDVSCINETVNCNTEFRSTVVDKNNKNFETSSEKEIKGNNYEDNISNEEIVDIESNSLQKNVLNSDLKAQSPDTKDNKKYLDIEKEIVNTNSDKIENDNNFHNKDKQIIDNLEEKIFESKNYLISENDSFATNKEVDKLSDFELQTKMEKEFIDKDSSDFCNVNKTCIQEIKLEEKKLNTKPYESCDDLSNENESFIQESKLKQKNFASKSCETVKNVGKNKLASVDAFTSSPKKSKGNLYHAPYRNPSTMHFPLGLRNQEQSVSKIYKSPNYNSQPRPSVKSSFDLSNNRQLKAKSNLNLACAERTSPLPSHRRSKSYVNPRDVLLNLKNTKEKKYSFESSALSNKTSPKSPREFRRNDERDKKFDFGRENSFESLSISSKSSSKSRIPISSDNNEMKRSSSFKSLTLSSRSSSKSHILITPRDSLSEDQNNKVDMKRKVSMESLMSNKSSKSCIPILKNRETIRKDGCDLKSKNLMQSSLEIETSKNDEEIRTMKENLDKANEEEITRSHSVDTLDRHTLEPQYNNVNSNQRTADCNYASNENISKHQVQHEVEKETQNDPIMVDQNEVSGSSSQDTVAIRVESNNKDSADTLSTNTSISDSLDTSDADKNKITEFKIFQVPEELTKEEYIQLLEVVNEVSDLERSSNMEKLCSVLGLSIHK